MEEEAEEVPEETEEEEEEVEVPAPGPCKNLWYQETSRMETIQIINKPQMGNYKDQFMDFLSAIIAGVQVTNDKIAQWNYMIEPQETEELLTRTGTEARQFRKKLKKIWFTYQNYFASNLLLLFCF